MKEINNYKLICSLLNFESEDDFYFVQIIRRRKENPELKKNSQTLKTYRVNSLESLLSLEEEIKKLCKTFNARAYINLNKRSFKEVGLSMIKETMERAIRGNYKGMYTVYDSCSGKSSNKRNKFWLIDVDLLDHNASFVHDLITDLIKFQTEAGHAPVTHLIPSVNGIHIITHKFNLLKFSKNYKLDVHKDNPTILYYDGI
jgi:hypothetical protein